MAESRRQFMHQVLVRWLGAACLLVGAPACLIGQQQPTPANRAAAVSAVMEYRIGWMEDSTAFDACSIRRALGREAGQPLPLTRNATRLLRDSEGGSCGNRAHLGPRSVRLDSLSTSDTTAVVHLTVAKGERIHREVFTLIPLGQARVWAVREVRIWGALRVHAPPPSSSHPGQGHPAG